MALSVLQFWRLKQQLATRALEIIHWERPGVFMLSNETRFIPMKVFDHFSCSNYLGVTDPLRKILKNSCVIANIQANNGEISHMAPRKRDLPQNFKKTARLMLSKRNTHATPGRKKRNCFERLSTRELHAKFYLQKEFEIPLILLTHRTTQHFVLAVGLSTSQTQPKLRESTRARNVFASANNFGKAFRALRREGVSAQPLTQRLSKSSQANPWSYIHFASLSWFSLHGLFSRSGVVSQIVFFFKLSYHTSRLTFVSSSSVVRSE